MLTWHLKLRLVIKMSTIWLGLSIETWLSFWKYRNGLKCKKKKIHHVKFNETATSYTIILLRVPTSNDKWQTIISTGKFFAKLEIKEHNNKKHRNKKGNLTVYLLLYGFVSGPWYPSTLQGDWEQHFSTLQYPLRIIMLLRCWYPLSCRWR